MENRFGFRELVISVLLAAMIVSVWLAMVEFDRQGVQLREMSEQIKEQTHDLAQVHRMLAEGIQAMAPVVPANSNPIAAASTTQPDELGVWVGADIDPFRRIKFAEKMPGYTVGDNFVDAFGVLPDNLTPLISSDAYSSDLQGYVLESLAGRDPDTLDWYPLLAKAWRISKDGLRIEFEVRKGVTFSDGEPLTADDVVFSYQWLMNPDVQDPRAKSYFDKIASVEKVGDDHVVFRYKEPYFQAFDQAASMSIMPKHFYGKFTPTEFNRSTGLLLGSGPYRMPDPAGWKPEPGKPIELVRNERYWGEPAPFDHLSFKIITDESARLTTFENGEIDTFGPTPEQYKSMVKDEKILARTQHFEIDNPTSGYLYIGWNERRHDKPTLFADKKMRQAMTLIVDRQGICDNIFLGLASVATGPFNRMTKQANPNLKPWPYDIARAKQLLKEAGFEDRDGSGILKSADGTPLSFKLSFPAEGALYRRVVLYIKDTCARAGVDVQPDPTAWNLLLKRLDQRDFDAISLGWSGDIEGDPFQIFDSKQIAGTGDNCISYSDPELDKLIEKARTTVDEKLRMPMWHRVDEIIYDDQPYTFLTVGKQLVFADKRLKNLQQVKTGLNSQLEWFVPRDQWRWMKPN